MHAHLQALRQKHENLEEKIHKENTHAFRDDSFVRHLKGEKLRLKDEIYKLEKQSA